MSGAAEVVALCQVVALQEVLAGERAWVVLHGDCAAVMAAMEPRGVDHVIADPPYEAEAHSLQRRVKRPHSTDASAWGPDTRVARIESLPFPPLTEAQRVAYARCFAQISRRWAVVFCQVEAAMKWQETMEAAGLSRRRIGVWVKPDGQPQLSGDRPGMGYESLVFMHSPGKSRWNGGGRRSVFTHNKWHPESGVNIHPTQKPLPLLIELAELFTDEGEVVLDPFAGSGSLGVACLRLGRRYIGIELDAKYAQDARDWLSAEQSGLTLGAARGGQMSLLGAGR